MIPTDCPKICTLEYRPICGSDGKTYGNICMFNAAKCRAAKAGKSLKVANKGKCIPGMVCA